MYKLLTKNGTLFAFLLGIVVVIVFYGAVAAGLEAFNAIPEEDQPTSEEGNMFLPGMYLTAALVVIAAVAAILFGIYQVATNPKGALKGIIGVAALIVIFLIAWQTADSAIDPKYNTADFNFADEGVSKYVGGAIGTTVILIALALLGLVASEIRNFFK